MLEAKRGESKLEIEVAVLCAAGLEDDEILRLAGLRQRVVRGDCDELTPEHKRLSFVRYLYERGSLSADTIPDTPADIDP